MNPGDTFQAKNPNAQDNKNTMLIAAGALVIGGLLYMKSKKKTKASGLNAPKRRKRKTNKKRK